MELIFESIGGHFVANTQTDDSFNHWICKLFSYGCLPSKSLRGNFLISIPKHEFVEAMEKLKADGFSVHSISDVPVELH